MERCLFAALERSERLRQFCLVGYYKVFRIPHSSSSCDCIFSPGLEAEQWPDSDLELLEGVLCLHCMIIICVFHTY